MPPAKPDPDSAASWDAAGTSPVLATPAQIETEKTLLRLIDAPALKAIKTELHDELAETARGRTKTGAATLGNAIEQWTRSVLLAEIVTRLPTAAVVWGVDNTPREWLGHRLGGVGMSGDNPDAIYRVAVIDGARRYEVRGRFDPERRPVQQTLELHRGNLATPPPIDLERSDLTPLASISDRDLEIAPDGSFRLTVGPEPESPVHLGSEPGLLTLGFRDMLSDWQQRPSRLELRPLDEAPSRPLDADAALRAACDDLPGFVRFWARFPDLWMGGLSGNRIAPTQGRSGGLAGFMAGMSFELAPDRALAVTTVPGAAAYTGFQLTDPWMIGPDARRFPVCLNLSQSVPNPDGTCTYVISERDPGVANWLATAGLEEGIGILRWQAVPADASMAAADLVREFRVLPFEEVAGLRDVPRASPEQRRAQLAARARGYDQRVR